MKDGRYLVTEINGNWVSAMTWMAKFRGRCTRLELHIHLRRRIAPDVYVTEVDFSQPGAIVTFNSKGKLLWKFKPTGSAALDHTSLATGLPNGMIIATDDANHRVIVIDPKTKEIVWQYGHKGKMGTGTGYLNNPDGLELIPDSALANFKLA